MQFYINPNIPSYDIPQDNNCSESDAGHYDEEFSKNYFELPVEYQKFNSVDIRITLDIKLSDIFVLTSNYEGLPNVLLEAQGQKKYILSFEWDDFRNKKRFVKARG